MESLKGHLLIATPQLIAPIFSRSVILMVEHSSTGAAGLILNLRTEATVASIAEQVMEESSDWEQPITLGGPVPGPLVVLHSLADLADYEVVPGVYSTTDVDKVRDLVRAKADPSLTIANYSGWAPGQLEGEIESGSWYTLPARAKHVFAENPDELWRAVIKEYRGQNLSRALRLKEIPDDPSLN